MNKFIINARFLLLFSMVVAVFSCNPDDEIPTPPVTDTVVASFQFEVDDTDPLKVNFSNFSQNATSYSWDFGDGAGTSTEEAPSYTYASGGSYTVVLTATGADNKTSDKSETVSVTNPNDVLALLAGSGSKTWYLQREGIALGIGPAPGNSEWWSFGGVTPLGDRPCILDDSFTFNTDGTMEFNSNGTIFIDSEGNGGWLGPQAAEGCFDDTDAANMTSVNGDDLSAFASGSYTYDYDPTANTLTLNGDGAYVGLPNKTAAGDNYLIQSTKVYNIFNFVEGTTADSLQMSIDINGGVDGSWNFYLVSYENASDLPDIPGSMPSASFSSAVDGFNVTFTNTSTASTNYMWDFGDGGTSPDASPTHTYSAEGEYTVTLTAMDDMGGSDMATQNVIISSASFTAAALSNATGKVWKLDGENSYFVGPNPGDGSWWGGLDAAGVEERACQMDDEFIFFDNGTMEYDSKGDTWAEAYMGGNNSCLLDDDIPSPYDVLASGTHAFTATDTEVTAVGNGAFIGFSKANNSGELDGTVAPASSITYSVIDYAVAGNKEVVTIAVDYTAGFWTMRLFSEN